MTIEELYSIYLQSKRVNTDTRTIQKGDLFFALKGAHFNGNLFAKEAIEQGALAAIVDEKDYSDIDNHIFYFEDVLKTLQELARYHRQQITIPVIGLTGSNGKTTSKELMASVLKQKYKVWYTQGNLNNHIGVPLTILSIKPEHEIAIVEMGANHQKEIEFLSSISQPDIGYITNFGKAHLGGFGGVEGVIKGKSELYTFLRNYNRKVLLNTDDPKQVELTKNISAITFGEKGEYSFVLLEDVNHFVGIKYFDVSIQSHLTGKYNYSNLSAATTLGLYFGLDVQQIKQGIENYYPNNQRSQVVNKNGITWVLDAYNANPSSMEVALRNFALFKGTKAVILGSMFELGEESVNEHQKIVDLVISLAFEFVYLVGEDFYNTSIQETDCVYKFHTTEEMIDFFKSYNISANNVLLKGSRGMALDRLLDHLV